MLDEIKGSRINEKPSSTMSVKFCTGATFVKKNSCFVARIAAFDTVGLHLLLSVFKSHSHPKILHLISVTLSHINGIIIVLFKSYLKQCF